MLHVPPAMCTRQQDLPWYNATWDFFDNENTCTNRFRDQKFNGYDFQEIERWVDFNQDGSDVGDYCPDTFSYSTIIRNPLKRIASHMSAHEKTWDEVKLWLESTEHPGPRDFIFSFVAVDNYFIRMLGGRDAFL